MSKVRHVLGISGGKDSAALSIYLKQRHPDLTVEYYFTDTGKELEETYDVLNRLESYLGQTILKLNSVSGSNEDPFDHFLKLYGGYLPSSTARWCTKKLKLEPFEDFVGDDPVVSYVGIRGDEDREGYISKKSNIQSIFPFRRNIWSEDVIKLILKSENKEALKKFAEQFGNSDKAAGFQSVLDQPLSFAYNASQKLNALLDLDTKLFNRIVFEFLKGTEYPVGKLDSFPLVENDDVLVRDDIFKLLRESGVGVPEYYEKRDYEVEGKKGHYARSRSGCFFCFFQQKIEWVWLYEQHPERFKKAMEYEKDGYSWMDNERLEDLIKPERIKQIKEDHLKRVEAGKNNSKSPYLIDILSDAEGEGCAACFI